MKKVLALLGVSVVSVAAAVLTISIFRSLNDVEIRISGSKSGATVSGAEFQLYTCENDAPGHEHDGEHCTLSAAGDPVSSDADGMLRFENLSDSKVYFIEEISAPLGYSDTDGLLRLTFDDEGYTLMPVGDDPTVMSTVLVRDVTGRYELSLTSAGEIDYFLNVYDEPIGPGEIAASINVPMGTTADAAGLPEKLKALDKDGTLVLVPVTWTSEDYDGYTVGEYSFTAVIGGEFTYASDAPTAAACVTSETRAVVDAYVPGMAELSSLTLQSKIDGTAPWDSDNNPGNDAAPDNNIVRSNDSISYNVAYALDLKDAAASSVLGYNHARLYVRATLPLASAKATFDLDAMPWLMDAYVTESTGSQTLTGYYDIEKSDQTVPYVVPGNGTLRFVLKVGSMDNNTTVTPTFEVWLDDGNNTNHRAAANEKVTPAATTVSATAKYDVALIPLAKTDVEANASRKTLTGGSYSAVCSIGVYVSAKGSSKEKGLKGLTLPSNMNISFDLTPEYYQISSRGTETLKGSLSTKTSSYKPSVWDYSEIKNDTAVKGVSGRPMTHTNVPNDKAMGRLDLPFSHRDTHNLTNAVYDSGKMSVTTNSTTKTISVTFSAVKTDGNYPMTAARANTSGSLASVPVDGMLACGTVEILFPMVDNRSSGDDDDDDDWSKQYVDLSHRLTVNVKNLKVNSMTATDSDSTNNRVSWEQNLQSSTSHSAQVDLGLVTYDQSASVTHAGRGDVLEFYTCACQDYPFDQSNQRAKYPTMAADHMILFDGEVFEPVNWYGGVDKLEMYYGFSSTRYKNGPTYDASDFTAKVWYIAKTDGTTWSSEAEMSQCHYYTFLQSGRYRVYPTLDALHEALGSEACCVGLYIEIRSKNDTHLWFGEGVTAYFDLKVRDSAPVGKATVLKQEAALLSTNTASSVGGGRNIVGSTEAVILGYPVSVNSSNYGGQTPANPKSLSTGTSYNYSSSTSNFAKPTWQYTSAVFNANGIMTASDRTTAPNNVRWNGTAGGATIFIAGERATISKAVAMTSDGAPKQSFWVNDGERYADFILTPTLANVYSSTNSSSGKTSDITITDTLPKGLTYMTGSCCLGGIYNQPEDNCCTGTVEGGTLLTENETLTGVTTAIGSTGDVTMTVTENNDGTTTLTWTLTQIQVGKEIPKICYSTYIGDENDAFNEVVDGQQLVNTATIVSSGSDSKPSAENGNLATAAIRVYKVSGEMFAKTAQSPLVNQGEDIVYYIDYHNTTQKTLSEVKIRDLLPYDGDSRGSVVHGTYTVSVRVEKQNSAGGSLSLRYTSNAGVAGYEDDAFNTRLGSYTWRTASGKTSGSTVDFGSIGQQKLIELVASNVGAGARFRIFVTLSPTNKGGDIFCNTAALLESGSTEAFYTPTARTEVDYAKLIIHTVIDNMLDDYSERIASTPFMYNLRTFAGFGHAGTTQVTGGTVKRFNFAKFPMNVVTTEFSFVHGRTNVFPIEDISSANWAGLLTYVSLEPASGTSDEHISFSHIEFGDNTRAYTYSDTPADSDNINDLSLWPEDQLYYEKNTSYKASTYFTSSYAQNHWANEVDAFTVAELIKPGQTAEITLHFRYNPDIDELPTPPPPDPKVTKTVDYLGDGVPNPDTSAKGDNDYRLYLTLNTEQKMEASKKKDVIFVLDTSGSMDAKNNDDKDDRIGTLQRVTTRTIKYILDCDSTNTISLIKFSSGAEILAERQTNYDALEEIVNMLPATGATDYYDGLMSAADIIKGLGNLEDRETVVFFVSDGQPTSAVSVAKLSGNDSHADVATYYAAEAAKQLSLACRVDRFYSVFIGSNKGYASTLQTITQKVVVSEGGEKYMLMAENEAQLERAFKRFLNKMDNTLIDPIILDELSDHVDYLGNIKVECKKIDGTPVELIEGLDYKTVYSERKRSVEVEFLNNTLPDSHYTFSFNVRCNDLARNSFAGTGIYPDVGDENTDYGTNATSSGLPGFYSNKEATLSYWYNNVSQATATYPKPVVQVHEPELRITLQKTLMNKQLEENMFTFELLDLQGNVLATAKNGSAGDVIFDTTYVSEPGSYSFRVREQIPDPQEPGMIYDTHEVPVNVTVGRNEYGKLVLTSVDYQASTTFVNNYAPTAAEITLSATKVYTDQSGRARTLSGGDFSFSLMEGNRQLQTVQNDARGNITFAPIQLTRTGVYNFTIREVIPTGADPNIHFDTRTINVSAIVTDVNGVLQAELVYPEDTAFRNVYGQTPTSTVTPGSASATVQLRKVLNGTDLLQDMFEFELRDTATGKLYKTTNRANGDIIFNLSYTKAGEYHYTVREVVPAEPIEYMTYSDEIIEVTVKVINNGGRYTTQVTYSTDDPTFYNAYQITGVIW